MKKTTLLILILVMFTQGCATTLRTSPTYQESIKEIKTIAVMPPDIRVYRLTAGGIREQMDEWTDISIVNAKEALKENLSQRLDFEIKFIEEDWLKSNYPKLWRQSSALYGAVAISALLHSIDTDNTFQTKKEKFEYTLGSEIQSFSSKLDCDAILFIYGYDHDATIGRSIFNAFSFAVGVYTGFFMAQGNPSAMMLGLIDADTGNLEWFKTSAPNMEYRFRSKKHMDSLVEWLTRHFVKEERTKPKSSSQ